MGRYTVVLFDADNTLLDFSRAERAALCDALTAFGVTPDDVKMLRHQVLRHRIALSYAAVADHVDVETVIDRIIGAVRTP